MERIYVIDDKRGKTTYQVEVYDPQTDSWSRVLLCPKEQDHAATPAYNSK
jgi:hypothetical protein